MTAPLRRLMTWHPRRGYVLAVLRCGHTVTRTRSAFSPRRRPTRLYCEVCAAHPRPKPTEGL